MGHITAEKQSPSAIQFYADLKEAIALERRLQQGSKPLKDVLSKIVADYNRMTTVRSHRIDTNRRNMAYNLLLSIRHENENFMSYSCAWGMGYCPGFGCWHWYMRLRAPPEFHQVVHDHYDSYKHSQTEESHGNILRVVGYNHYYSPFPPGITLDILALDFWVPGSCSRADAPQYKGKEVFREILEVTSAVSILYVERVTKDSIIISIAW